MVVTVLDAFETDLREFEILRDFKSHEFDVRPHFVF